MTACSWDHPGADRYTGTVAAAMAAYHLPAATQAALIDAWERRQFVDHVVIDRDSIRGRSADYRPDIRGMHFGSRGKVCDTVTRAGWTADHAETAVVLCADAECLAVPAVCLNVFRLIRIERGAAPAVLGEAVDGDPAGPIGTGTGLPIFIPQARPIADGQGAYAAGSWGASAGFGYGVAYAAAQPLPSPAVPEPGAWSLMAIAAALMAWRLRR